MAIQAMHTAATGMEAFTFNLDNIANNLANAGTTGFKRQRVNFEDLIYQHLRTPGAPDASGQPIPLGVSVGLGSRVSSTERDHSMGSMIATKKPLDLAISGDGFFQVLDLATGRTLYTRAGTFTRNSEGAVVMSSAGVGRPLEPQITLPPDTQEISISADGTISVLTAGSTTQQQLGQIELVKFVNPAGLLSLGDNVYSATDASGQPLVGTPNTEGRGSVQQGFLESSNVEPVTELVDLIKTQRNIEMTSQVIQAADQTLQLLANLRRF